MKVIICGGGTVGHLTPGISIAEIILNNEKNSKILFIGRENGEENEVVTKHGFELKTLEIMPFQRRLSTKNLKALTLLSKAIKNAKAIIRSEKPNIVIGTGGYVCWPVIKAAQKLNVPTIIHESNFCPGVATKRLAGECDKVLLHFSQSEIHFKRKDNLITVGNPIPKAFGEISREYARRKLGLSPKDFFILSFGGSGGAEKINECIISLMKSFSTKKQEIKHVHACGKRYIEKIKAEHPRLTDGYSGCKIIPFIHEMPLYMKAADTVISRCGAMTLSELAECETVPILIPSPNVTNNHQYKNAKVFTDNGAALMIEENELNDRTLLDAVRYLISNKSVRDAMKNKLKNFKSENTEKSIYEIIKSNAKN